MFKKLLKMIGYIFFALIAFIVLAVIFGDEKTKSKSVSAQDQTTKRPESALESPASKEIKWNLTNPDAISNGNIRLAVKHIKSGADAASGITADAATVLKTPWKYYGQSVCFNGTVALVEDQPPGSDISKALGGGDTSEVVIETSDGSIVDLLALESSGSLKLQDLAMVCGFPVGRAEVANAVGGKFTHLLVVGFIQ